MRRVLGLLALLVAVAAVALVVSGAGGDGGGYKVRAIFDNAGFIIPGEDVKVAGVEVGKVDSLDVTPDHKAAIVLDITDPGYQDFRRDAGCIVRPQGLIGERYVECTLTEQRSPGEQPPPPLARITEGEGTGEYLLPVQQNSTAVDLDLIGDIMREPERQRLSLILNELGTGLAGRGADLNAVIRRADPALREVDKLLAIIGSQNRQLAELARNSDTVLAPLARERTRVADSIDSSGRVAAATAERSADLEADISKLPRFLSELKPTMTRLGALSDEMTPVLSDLGDVAPDINRLILQLGPFSQAAIPAFDSLGDAAEVGTPAVQAARPVIGDVRRLADVLRPVGATARAVLTSFQRNHGIERAMDYILYQATAINGFDSVGHYLRAALIVNQCASYAVKPTPGCSANFISPSASGATATAASGPRDQTLLRTAEALRRALGKELRTAKARAKHGAGHRRTARHGGGEEHGRGTAAPDRSGGGTTPRAAATPTATPAAPSATATPAPAAPAPAATPAATPTPAPSGGGTANDDQTLLDYLFGNDD